MIVAVLRGCLTCTGTAEAQQAKELLEKQNAALMAEVTVRAEQLLSVQRNHGNEIGALTGEIEALKSQRAEWEARCVSVGYSCVCTCRYSKFIRYEATAKELVDVQQRLTEAQLALQEERSANARIMSEYQGMFPGHALPNRLLICETRRT